MKPFPKLGHAEFSALKALGTPGDIQDFLNSMPINYERGGQTCRSVRAALLRNEAQCMEGALIAAAALWMQGHPPIIVDLKTSDDDVDHVIAVFKTDGRWGSITKTNHAVLRYRDPVYKNLRELVMSYFNEYFLNNGKKTLRSYSVPFRLSTAELSWLTSSTHLWELREKLDKSRHIQLISKTDVKRLRPADKIEIEAGKIVEFKRTRPV